jgi:hypothetical protein
MFEAAPTAEARAQADKAAKLEQIRATDPGMAQQIEETGPLKALAVGAGRITSKVGSVFGLADKESDRVKSTMEALKEQQPAAGAGEFIAEAAMSSLVGGPVGAAARTALGKAAAGTAAGAVEGGVMAAADDGDAGDIALAAATGGFAGRIFGGKTRLTGKQKGIVKELSENPDNPDFAKFLVVDGKPQESKLLKDAASAFGGKQGNEFVAVAKNGSKADKAATRKMLATIREGIKNPKFRDSNRVGDVVGKSLTRRVENLGQIKSRAGKRIDEIAKAELTDKVVDISAAKRQFADALEGLRVGVNEDGSLNFVGSALEGKNAGSAQTLVEVIQRRIGDTKVKASDAHFIKQFIDNQVTFGKADGGLSGDLDRAVKQLRKGINNSVRKVSKNYAKENDKYSEVIDALDSLQDAGGSKLDIENPKALGVTLRRLTSNAQSRAPLEESINKIDDILAKNGIRYKDSISHQNHLANALEKRFKLSGSTTHQSEVGQGVAREIRRGPTDVAFDVAGKAYDKLMSKDDSQAIEALMKAMK